MIRAPVRRRPSPGARCPTSLLLSVLLVPVLAACAAPDMNRPTDGSEALLNEIRAAERERGVEVAVYYRDLSPGGDSVVHNGDVRMHAASTMKVPVMMRLFLDHQDGRRSLDDSVQIRTTFRSIVDGSEFVLPPTSDSDTTFYGRVGEEATVREIVDRMITWSSNLATNILVETADPARIASMLRAVGADSMEVLRGVEDLKAFEAGRSNTTTARALGAVMAAVAGWDGFTEESRETMLGILERQHFRDAIPAGLPAGVRVANKTGWITRIQHDAAIVLPEGAPAYVLVVMVRGAEEGAVGDALAARISRAVWQYHTDRHGTPPRS